MIVLAYLGLSWELNAPFTQDLKSVYAVEVHVDQNGEEHQATFDLVVRTKKPDGDKRVLEIAMEALEVDGNSTGEALSFAGTYNEKGFLTSLDAETDDMRRMFAPFLFNYPNVSVSDNSTWKFEWNQSAKIPVAIEGTIKGSEGEGDAQLLKVESKFEEGKGGETRAAGTWWIRKDNRVSRFEIKLTGWVVPLAGNDPISASVKGTLKS